MAEYISASKLARAEVCPASMALPAVITPGSRYANAGNDTHDQLERVALGKREGVPEWLCVAYDELTAGATEVFAERCYAWSPETGRGRDLGTHGRDYSGLQPGEIGGTVDLVVVRPEGVTVLDYKSGYKGSPLETPQLSLLALAIAGARGLDSITVGIVQIDADDEHVGAPVTMTLDDGDLRMEAARVRRIVRRVGEARHLVSIGKTPDVKITDDGCRYCPCKLSCPGRVGAIATLAGMVGLAAPKVMIPVTVENAGAVWLAIDAMKSVLKAAEDEVKALARTAPVPLPDGRELWCEESSRETVGDIDKAAAVIAEVYGEAAVSEALVVERSMTKGAIEKIAKKRAEGRTGTKAAIAFVERVRAAGALKKAPYLSYPVKERKVGLPMNNITIAGTVGKDASLRSAGSVPVVSFSVGVSNGKDKEGNWRDSTWFECSLWDKRATEKVAALITKGSKVTVSGSVSLRKWEKDGKSGASLELRVNDWDFQGSGGGGDRVKKGSDDDFGPGASGGGGAGPGEDDIPF